MKAPESLETLIEYGIIQEVIRPLMSGKEAQVFVVLAGGEESVAKVYKEAHQRTFKHRSDYTEGRRTRNTRDQRAINKRSQHGRKKDEDAWRTAEVEMIYRLRDAGVRVPEPINFVEGVLVMELVKDVEGQPAPRLGDLTFSPEEARAIYDKLIREVVRMLCAGVVHGDLSDFNVLMSKDGPVVIDFPQAVDPTHNTNARKLLLRDVENLHRFLTRFAPDEPVRPYGEEIWSLYEANRLRPDTRLGGRYEAPKGKVDTEEVMALIDDASRDAQKRRGEYEGEYEGEGADDEDESGIGPVTARPFRKVVDFSAERAGRPAAKKGASRPRKDRPARRSRSNRDERVPPSGPASQASAKNDDSPTRPRRKRASRRGSESNARSDGAREPEARRRKTGEEARNPKGASSAGEAVAKERSDKPRRPRNRRRRTGTRDSAEANAGEKGASKSPKRAPESRSASKGPERPAGEARSDRPRRRRRRRSPNTSSAQ